MRVSAYIKQEFIKFFQSKFHKLYPHSILAPPNYDTTMFTIAGMKQFQDIFLGNQTTEDKRAISVQPCLRTNDIENVGKTLRHHTFFEMLGNFSFGDYFKKEAIDFAFEFLTEIIKLDKQYLYYTVHANDQESYEIWLEKVEKNRVIKLNTDDNFWRSGKLGPCGYSTEIYFDTKMQQNNQESIIESIINGEDRYLEVWNLVFMEYNQTNQGLELLKTKHVDCGMGLERLTSVYTKTFDNYKTDCLLPIVEKANEKTGDLTKSKIVADHMKAITFLIGEGLKPSHSAQGYVLRNLIRRSAVFHPSLSDLVDIVLEYFEDYSQNFISTDEIKEILNQEQEHFNSVLQRAIKVLNEQEEINEEIVFKLYDTYGLPTTVIKTLIPEKTIDWNKVEELKEQHSMVSKRKLVVNFETPTQQVDFDIHKLQNVKVEFLGQLDENLVDFEKKNEIFKEKCIVVTNQTCFYPRGGGQEGDQGIIQNDQCKLRVFDTIKQRISSSQYIVLHLCEIISGKIQLNDLVSMEINSELRQGRANAHSATHLVSEFFIRKFNYSVCGSFVDDNFLHLDIDIKNEKDLKHLISDAEKHVKKAIEDKISSNIYFANIDEVEDAIFNQEFNYDKNVRIIDFPGVSKQLCGGTHVKNTAEIQDFIITKEYSKKSGVRRIEAFVGKKVQEYLKLQEEKQASSIQEELFFEITNSFELNNILFIFIKSNHDKKIHKIMQKNENKSFVIIVENSEKTQFIFHKCENCVKKFRDKFELKGGGKEIIRMGSKEKIPLENIETFIKQL